MTILDHLSYNVWANSRVREMIDGVSEELAFREIQSSFPSIAKTVLHIWDAQTIWHRRMEGVSLSAFPSKDFKGTKQDAIIGLINSSNELLSFIQKRGPEFLKSQYSYKNLKGDSFNDIVEDTLYHVVNHGTYHRGQITTMLRAAGVTNLLSTDLIVYLRSQK
jgi:uncharacterized damage-inducible protein DinB